MPQGHYENLAKYRNRLLPFICRTDTLRLPTYLFPHWHEGTEILYCTSGAGRAIISGNTFDFSPGKIVIVNPGQIHSVMGEPEISYKCIIIFEEFCNENGIDKDKYTFASVVDKKNVIDIYQKMYDDFKSGESAIKIRLDAMELLYNLEKDCTGEIASINTASSEDIKSAIDYTNRNFGEDITLDKIAEIAGLSKFYFTKKFKEMTGTTYSDFLGSVRCQRASELIKDGKNANEACFAVGYNDPAYFSRVFKKFMGVAPSKYK